MLDSKSVAVILPAAGSGRRFGASENKLFCHLAGRPLWVHSVETLCQHEAVGRLVLAVSPSDLDTFQAQLEGVHADKPIELVSGGKERIDSVLAGVQRVGDDESITWIAVHDAARPLLTCQDLDRVFASVGSSGAAILAEPVTSTVKRTRDEGVSCETLDRSELWLAQTPQVFRKDLLAMAYRYHRGRHATDDAELVSRLGVKVAIAPGSSDNLKITFPQDLFVAEAILKGRQASTR
ncbi:MAG: 2-C-methyl-D-erythritol 4-phosphate cytidylyltransferase [Planctomycetota bacterium]